MENANTAKSQLQAVIDTSETAKSNLSTVIASANEINTTLSATIQTGTELNASLNAQNSQALANIANLSDENFKADEILTGVDDIKAYLGYTDEDIAGICVDYQNKTFKRLAGAYDKEAGADFDVFAMFGGRKGIHCTTDEQILSNYGWSDAVG